VTAPARFKQADVARAYKALTGAGMRVGRVEIDHTGKIIILGERDAAKPSAANEWDEVLR
jgi:hypothetical protein